MLAFNDKDVKTTYVMQVIIEIFLIIKMEYNYKEINPDY